MTTEHPSIPTEYICGRGDCNGTIGIFQGMYISDGKERFGNYYARCGSCTETLRMGGCLVTGVTLEEMRMNLARDVLVNRLRSL